MEVEVLKILQCVENVCCSSVISMLSELDQTGCVIAVKTNQSPLYTYKKKRRKEKKDRK